MKERAVGPRGLPIVGGSRGNQWEIDEATGYAYSYNNTLLRRVGRIVFGSSVVKAGGGFLVGCALLTAPAYLVGETAAELLMPSVGDKPPVSEIFVNNLKNMVDDLGDFAISRLPLVDATNNNVGTVSPQGK